VNAAIWPVHRNNREPTLHSNEPFKAIKISHKKSDLRLH
jgi:hypothetical protein